MINSKSYSFSQAQVYRYGFDICFDVYEKFDHKCLECGSQEYLNIHHIDKSGQTDNPNNSLDNLQLLCRSCHARLHANDDWAKRIEEQGGYRSGKEYLCEYRKKYREQHREEMNAYFREYAREYRKNNAEKRREWARQWRLRNPEKVKANNAKRSKNPRTGRLNT